MGEKGKRRGQKGKISASEASPAVVRGGGKAATLSPPETTSWLASLAYFVLFPQMQSLVPSYIYKTDVTLKWIPRVGPCLSLLLLVDVL